MELVLVDASHLMYRSQATFGKFTTKGNYPTGIQFGVMRALDHLKRMKPEAVIVFCFDGHPGQRKQLDPEYKGNREHAAGMADAVYDPESTMDVKQLIVESGCAWSYHEEYESDDLIAMWADLSRFTRVYIYSGDDDFCQLVSRRVTVWKPPAGKGHPERMVTRDEVFEEWGVWPNSLALYRSFLGDSGDNITGVPRIPRDRLQQAVSGKMEPEEFFDGDGLAYFTPEWRAKITEERARVEKNFRLTKLPWDTLPQLPVTFAPGAPNAEQLKSMFVRLEFSSFLKKFDSFMELLEKAPYASKVPNLSD